MITREQCRAARGLLGWTQQHLADAAGLSKTAINNFERGMHDMRMESLTAIQGAFEDADIEFAGNFGVSKRQDAVRVLRGPTVALDLWDDIHAALSETGGEVLIMNTGERAPYEAHGEKLLEHLRRLSAAGITERLLCCEGDTFFLQPVECYRWLPKEVFRAGMTSFIYADRVALRLWQESITVIIHSRAAYEAEKQRFEHLWDAALVPRLTPEEIEKNRLSGNRKGN